MSLPSDFSDSSEQLVVCRKATIDGAPEKGFVYAPKPTPVLRLEQFYRLLVQNRHNFARDGSCPMEALKERCGHIPGSKHWKLHLSGYGYYALELVIRRGPYESSVHADTRPGKYDFVELFEYDVCGSKPVSDECVVSIRTDLQREKGEWQWIRPGERTSMTQAAQLADKISRSLAIEQVVLLDIQHIPHPLQRSLVPYTRIAYQICYDKPTVFADYGFDVLPLSFHGRGRLGGFRSIYGDDEGHFFGEQDKTRHQAAVRYFQRLEIRVCYRNIESDEEKQTFEDLVHRHLRERADNSRCRMGELFRKVYERYVTVTEDEPAGAIHDGHLERDDYSFLYRLLVGKPGDRGPHVQHAAALRSTAVMQATFAIDSNRPSAGISSKYASEKSLGRPKGRRRTDAPSGYTIDQICRENGCIASPLLRDYTVDENLRELNQWKLECDGLYRFIYASFHKGWPSEKCKLSFVLLGRGLDGRIPTLTADDIAAGHRVVLVVTPDQFKVVRNEVQNLAVDFLIIEGLRFGNGLTVDQAKVGLVTARRIASLLAGLHFNVSSFSVTDDNIGRIALPKELQRDGKHSYSEWFAFQERKANESGYPVLGAHTNDVQDQASLNLSAELPVESNQIVWKHYFYRAGALREALNGNLGNVLKLFPQRWDVWGEDYYQQFALEDLGVHTGKLGASTCVLERDDRTKRGAAKSKLHGTDKYWLTTPDTSFAAGELKRIVEENDAARAKTRKYWEELEPEKLSKMPRDSRRRKIANGDASAKTPKKKKRRKRPQNSMSAFQFQEHVFRLTPEQRSVLSLDASRLSVLLREGRSFLYKHQNAALAAVSRRLNEIAKNMLDRQEGRLGLDTWLEMATGTGKTFTMAALLCAQLKQNPSKNVMVVTPLVNLDAQMKASIEGFGKAYSDQSLTVLTVDNESVTVDRFLANKKLSEGGNVIVICENSLKNALEKKPELLQSYGLVMYDEVHKASPKLLSYFKEVSATGYLHFVGFTATGNARVQNGFETKSFTYGAREAIRAGILRPWKLEALPKELEAAWAGDNPEILSSAVESLVRQHAGEEGRGLIYTHFWRKVTPTALATTLASKLADCGAHAIHSNGGEGQDTLEAFHRKEDDYRILVSVDQLVMGFDAKDLNFGLVLRRFGKGGALSEDQTATFIQILGRFLRTSEGFKGVVPVYVPQSVFERLPPELIDPLAQQAVAPS